MLLTPIDEQRLIQAARLLENTQDLPTLTTTQVPMDMLFDLMASDKVDLAMIGCYLASRLDPSVDLSALEANAASARNYARFLLAQYPLTHVLAMARTNNLSGNAESLSARIPAALPALGAPAATNSLTIIIHGTWARTSPWWKQGGSFWNYINPQLSDLYKGPNPYSWSGGNSHSDRETAAKDLVTWIKANPTNSLRIITHSHGGNVCFLATRMGLAIDKLITLGTPIRLEYLPDLRQIGQLHNVLSTVDHVQTPAGTIPNRRGEGRTLGETDKVLNHRATDDGAGGQPGHSDLHEPPTWTACGLGALLL